MSGVLIYSRRIKSEFTDYVRIRVRVHFGKAMEMFVLRCFLLSAQEVAALSRKPLKEAGTLAPVHIKTSGCSTP